MGYIVPPPPPKDEPYNEGDTVLVDAVSSMWRWIAPENRIIEAGSCGHFRYAAKAVVKWTALDTAGELYYGLALDDYATIQVAPEKYVSLYRKAEIGIPLWRLYRDAWIVGSVLTGTIQTISYLLRK
jgi:hypothetical protein